MKLIVYYSYSGSCKTAAEYLQEKLEAEIVFLEEEKPFAKSIIGYIQAIFSALGDKKTLLSADFAEQVALAKQIYLIAPIWAGKTPPALNAFLAEAKLEGKTVNALTLQGDAKLSGSEKVLASIKDRVENAGGSIGQAQSIQGGSKRKPLSIEQAKERILFS